MIYATNVLKKSRAIGGFSYWQKFVKENSVGVYTETHFWQDNESGESSVQVTEPTYIVGKNIGRSNETTPKDQAILEVQSSEKRKRDEGFSETGKVSEKPLPMLAKVYADERSKIQFPCFAEVKGDGNRMESNGTEFWTRKGIDYIPEVVSHLRFNNRYNLIWDGELLLPGDQPLQTVNKAIKKVCPENKDLIYMIYDVMTDEPYHIRIKRVEALVREVKNPNIIVCPYWIVNNEDELLARHKQLVSSGKEGTIVRWGDEGYKSGLKRSSHLLKLKDFQDAEFLVTGVRDGVGKMKNSAVLQLITPSGKTFECVPEGTMERKHEIFKNASEHIGKYWTVRFFNYSLEGIPIFPVGVDLRDGT